jgi:hypothetical protein
LAYMHTGVTEVVAEFAPRDLRAHLPGDQRVERGEPKQKRPIGEDHRAERERHPRGYMAQPTRERIQREEDNVVFLRGITVIGVAVLGNVQVPAGIPSEQGPEQRVVQVPAGDGRSDDPEAHGHGGEDEQTGEAKHEADERQRPRA